MIKTKKELKYFIEEDRKALRIQKHSHFFFTELYFIQKFEVLLRKAEYHKNNKHFFLGKFYGYRLQKMRIKYGLFIWPNCFGPGLCISHLGSIVVNPHCLIGKNCQLHEGVTIGVGRKCLDVPSIGDNVVVCTGAKIIGKVSIANNVVIGANAVVTKTISDGGTWAGVPAKKISDAKSFDMLSPLLSINQ
jgi:serine O-acetyltransferase